MMMRKYLCINCKGSCEELPPVFSNECSAGHTHRFVKAASLLPDARRPLAKSGERREDFRLENA